MPNPNPTPQQVVTQALRDASEQLDRARRYRALYGLDFDGEQQALLSALAHQVAEFAAPLPHEQKRHSGRNQIPLTHAPGEAEWANFEPTYGPHRVSVSDLNSRADGED